MADFQSGQFGFPGVLDPTGDVETEVTGKVLEIGVGVASFRRDRHRQHVRCVRCVSDDVDPVTETSCPDLPVGSVGGTSDDRQRHGEANDVGSDADDYTADGG